MVAHLQFRTSQRTKTNTKCQQNRRQKKKGEGITAPTRNWGFSG